MLDRFYRRRYKILGGPGCGKTTKILEILANYIKGGLQLDQVLLIGFAKATVQELQNRVISKETNTYNYIEVNQMTLNDILKKLNLKKVNFIKVNIEGAEINLLKPLAENSFDIQNCAVLFFGRGRGLEESSR